MQSKKKYKAVIFDFDGTLIYSLEDIADAVNSMLEECGYATHTYDEYKHFVGNGFRNLVSLCLPAGVHAEANSLRYQSIALDHYRRNCIKKTRPYKGIPKLLDELSLKGVKMSILSNKSNELTRTMSDALLKRWKFEEVMGSDERFPRKPHPASALHIASEMGVEPERIVYMGDTKIDMFTAHAAGFLAVGVTWGFRTREELVAAGADMIIDSPEQLLKAELF